MAHRNVTCIRVRYSEIDKMGTFYNSRLLEWFECGRTEFLRDIGAPYRMMEERGVLLPVVEVHARYKGGARYDDVLELATTAEMTGKARIRFAMTLTDQSGRELASGHTVHAFVDVNSRPIRPPDWFIGSLENA